MNIEFEITQEDIDTGTANDSLKCAAGLALKRQGHKVVRVSKYLITLKDSGFLVTFQVPDNLYDFIDKFDRYYTVTPGKYTITKHS